MLLRESVVTNAAVNTFRDDQANASTTASMTADTDYERR